VIIRRRKRGYNVPIDEWFKKIINNRFIELIQSNKHNLYNQEYGIKLLNKIKRTGKNYKSNFYLAQKLWTLYIFEEWYDQYIHS